MNLYIGCNGFVAAIDPSTGREHWRTRLEKGMFSSTAQQSVCVLEHEGRVYAGGHGHLFALDARNGSILWRNELKGLGHNDVTLAIAGKSVQIVSRATDAAVDT
jgi:outer membrane protein assembly factor BamB